ncbi:FecR family protein [Massilia sp. R798]|uniref:FecR family protein n=1 Tax=Massilia soli TaxID=2792854 RepID=A0ABS7STN5_9BURK|nr:FecR family protein [Massilia soli]
MLKITAIAGLALCAQLALAAEAGKVIFVAGNAQVLDRQAAEGTAVQEGDMLQTGADGFLYIKTIDNGLFILRPNTKARIVTYHVDANNPANTRIKLDLISGVARSRSGDAVKQARQNFRFNTPVAAIGVRGTDFTVFTDDDTSRVSVITGGIVVSGFAGTCSPEGSGPCEGAASRELSAKQRGQLLQIKRGSQAPQLMSGSVMSSDQPALPAGAPLGNAASPPLSSPAAPVVDTQKAESLTKASNDSSNNGNNNPPAPPEPPPVVMPPPVTSVPPEPSKPVKEAGILWGRWEPVLGPAPDFNLTLEMGRNELVAVNGNFALFRTAGRTYVSPERGNIGFRMKDSEAYIYTNYGPSARTAAAATLSNGKLNIDFDTKRFATSFDMASKAELFSWSAQGAVGPDGRLYGDSADGVKGMVNVQGLLSNENGGSASYLFNGRIDERRTVNGATFWRQ